MMVHDNKEHNRTNHTNSAKQQQQHGSHIVRDVYHVHIRHQNRHRIR